MPAAKTKNKTTIISSFVPKSFFKNDSTYNEEGSRLLIEVDEFLKPIYKKYMDLGYNIREIQQIFNIVVTNNEVENSVKLSEKLYKEERQKVLDDRFN